MGHKEEKGTILIVDDTAATIDLIRSVLEGQGYDVMVATSGEKAVKRVEQRVPDLILMDVLMPGIDGFETCRLLKAEVRTREIPVIFMTGLTTTESKVTGFEAGGVDYVTKPIEIEEVLARVRTHLTLRRMHRQLEAQNERLQQELSERGRAEAALQESEEKYRLVIHNMPGLVYRGYADWSVEFMDKKVESVTGYRMEEFNSRQKKWSDIILEKGIETAEKAFLQALKTDRSYEREYRIRTRAGETLWIKDRGYIVCNSEERVEYISGVLFDVTERKDLEKALVQKEKFNTLGAIAAEVAHEIRNPLVSIGGFTRRLQQKHPDLRECDIILHESQRLEKILARIRNYLKPVQLHPRECSVNAIIGDSVDLLSPETKRRKVSCRLDLNPDLSAVYSDPDILTQIFVNLILNAGQAMDEGGILEIKTYETDQYIHIEFRNPVSREPIRNPDVLFMPFAEGGESIGLPLCYRMLKDMGGLLSCAPENGYLVFTVTLPKQGRHSRRKS
jgi:two-component system sensor histidine kinase HydH